MKRVKNYLRFLPVLLSLLALLSLGASAADGTSDELAREGVEELLHEFSLILPEGSEELASGGESALGIDSLLRELLSALGDGAPDALAFFLLVAGAAGVMACASLCPPELSGAVRSALTIISGGVLLTRLLPLVSELSLAFTELTEFFGSLAAILASAAALTGGGSVAAASGTGTSLALTVFGGICGALLPLVAVMLILGVTSAVSGGVGSSLLTSVRGWFTRGVGILTALLGGLFALQTAVATASDSATLRAVKYAASGSIPVVGGAVSGALSTLAGGLGYAVGVIGGGGVAAMLSISLAPLVKLLLFRLALFLASLFYEGLSLGEGEKCLSSLAYGLDALIAVYSLGAVIYILEAVLVMMSVTALL